MAPSLDFQKLLTNARKLVPFLPPTPISPREAKDQDASLLCSHLPPELRQMIWDTYFRGHVVHIYRSYKRLRGRECSKPDDGLTLGPHFGVCGLPANILFGHLWLLLTCKQMYVSCPLCSRASTDHLISYFECISTLYRETLFEFSHAPGLVPVMSERLPAAHINRISRVHLIWELYHPFVFKSKRKREDETLWENIWPALAAMEGLQWLTVELTLARTVVDTTYFTELESTMWEPVKKVTRPSHFELILPFPAAPSTREETLPCTIIRRLRSTDFH